MEYLRNELSEEQEIERLRSAGFGGAEHYSDVMRKALIYALDRYPEANRTDVCSWAALVESHVTGMYGGFGTELYKKEREAERLMVLFAGGWLDEGGEIGRTPPLDDAGQVKLPMDKREWTRSALWLLERFYFGQKTLKEQVEEAIGLLEKTKGAFRSNLVKRAREILERVKEQLE